MGHIEQLKQHTPPPEQDSVGRRAALLATVCECEEQIEDLLERRSLTPAEVWFWAECDDSLCDDTGYWLLSAELGYSQIEGRWRIALRERAVEHDSGQEITAPPRPLAEASLRLLMYFVPTPSAEQFLCAVMEQRAATQS